MNRKIFTFFLLILVPLFFACSLEEDYDFLGSWKSQTVEISEGVNGYYVYVFASSTLTRYVYDINDNMKEVHIEKNYYFDNLEKITIESDYLGTLVFTFISPNKIMDSNGLRYTRL